MEDLIKKYRFGVYGVVVGVLFGLLVTASGTWPRVVLMLILALALGWLGHDLQRTLLARVGAVAQTTRDTGIRIRAVDERSAVLERRSGATATALARLEEITAQTRAAAERQGTGPARVDRTRPLVLFVTSNGSGMGHLTRLMAVARAGGEDFDSTFLSLSSAAEVAARHGFPVLAVESQSRSGLTWAEWNRRFAEVLTDVLADERPDVVVFDGIQVFRGLSERTRAAGVPLVWMCRGLWKPDVPRAQAKHWRDVADLVVHPSEGALVPDADALPVAAAHGVVVPPIVMTDAAGLKSRGEALEELGLDPALRYVLVQLGSGALGSRVAWEESAVSAVAALGGSWRAVVLRSPLATADGAVEGAHVLRRYPVAPFLRAFEFSINAAGYNTVHENIALAQPAIYVPDENMLADDQGRRARALADLAAGLVASRPEDLEGSVRRLADDAMRASVVERLERIRQASGAREAARAVVELARSRAGTATLTVRHFAPTTTEEE